MKVRITWQMRDGFAGDQAKIYAGLERILSDVPPPYRYIKGSLTKYPTGVLTLAGMRFHAICWTMEVECVSDDPPTTLFAKYGHIAERLFPMLPMAQIAAETFTYEILTDT